MALTGGGRVLVDGAMRTSVADVYAAGDITSFPRACLAGGEGGGGGTESVSVAHWGLAAQQGKQRGLKN